MSKIELHTAISFLDGILSVNSIPDAPRALNGLQLENGGTVSKVAAAVDGSEKAIHAALETGADLLLLHHGIFWQPMQPITGIAYRKLKAAMDGNLAIYAAHLPLDVHPAYGNNALLAKACGLRPCSHDGQDPGEKTPVFVRFSTVQGFRGSPDTVRDIRGWATKFYTKEGNYDLVGNNTPVFFIQDAIKFPDFVHAVKPEPHNEMPQGQTAHDSFWDFVSLQPETLHNVMWAMSDRGIPRSFRTMEGFGIHTYKLVNEDGKSTFVRFHWKPLYGKKSLVWDEAQVLTGRDPDFHRKDLWQSIEAGDYPEYELGLQLIPEEDADQFDFDILDATKLIPEALVPVEIVGKMVLNRNPDNFFAETEQAAFCPANIVPGIDFSDDPLLQGRIFSYSDTQRHRLGASRCLFPQRSAGPAC